MTILMLPDDYNRFHFLLRKLGSRIVKLPRSQQQEPDLDIFVWEPSEKKTSYGPKMTKAERRWQLKNR